MGPSTAILLVWLHLLVSAYGNKDESFAKPYILSLVEEARSIVDEAYKFSREQSLNRVRSTASLADIWLLMKQPVGGTRSAVRAAEYMDMTLQLLREKASHDHKNFLNATDLLTAEDLDTIGKLTGCWAFQSAAPCNKTILMSKFRTITGICNNVRDTRLGSSNMPFTRWLPPQYQDGKSLPKGWDPKLKVNGFLLPMVREVSNRILHTDNKDVKQDNVYSHLVTIFGQWLDHDLILTPSSPSIRSFSNGVNCENTCAFTNPCFPIMIPPNDVRFKNNTNVKCLPFIRSAPACGSGEAGAWFGAANVRQQINAVTCFMDANQVYGSEDILARNLRNLHCDTGLMKVNSIYRDNGRDLLPFSNLQTCNTRGKITGNNSLQEVPCFLAGDVRVNENIGLTSLHTLMLREHNRLALALHQLNPKWSSERIYQEARKILGAFQQVIAYRDYLPHIIGTKNAQKLRLYQGYNDRVDPSISNVFATAAFRFAHLAIQPFIFRLDENYNEHPQFKSVLLHKVFTTPWRVVFEGGIDPVLRGLIGRPAQLNVQGHMMNDELREKLFQFTSQVALDLAALDMQRSRDHGLPGYNAWRRFCKLSVPRTVEQLAAVLQNKTMAQNLLKLYGTADNIDVWLGGVAEPFVPGGRVGPLFSCLIMRQFSQIRKSDRFWWQKKGVFTKQQVKSLSKVSMARIICDNTGITSVPKNPFLLSASGVKLTKCQDIPTVDLKPWKENKKEDQDSEEELPTNTTKAFDFSVRLGMVRPGSDAQVIVFREPTDGRSQPYNTQTGTFTCQVPGLYQFHFNCILLDSEKDVRLMRNTESEATSVIARQDSYLTASGGAVLLLKRGDKVWLQGSRGGMGLAVDSLFTGRLLFTV
ncbi:eosinophil peroxidase [Brienomyrus brachyistius]|uniref:eosinophil peroxidase n=1 Tax=Brienomyrus brachyistius TaxID=42636 RepID=UPI0020B3C8A0|nr:eosinophil peroxidase [Brienomyrus brachyistius]